MPIGDFVSLRILKGSFLPSLVLSFYDMMCSCLLPSIDWIGSYSLLRLIMRHLFFFCLVRSFFFTLTLLSLVVNVNHITYLFLFHLGYYYYFCFAYSSNSLLQRQFSSPQAFVCPPLR